MGAPTAFRPLFILLFGSTKAIGLVLGAFLTVHGTATGGLVQETAFSIVLGTTLWMAAALNSCLWMTSKLDGGAIQIATVFVGDLPGCAGLRFLISTILASAFAWPRRL